MLCSCVRVKDRVAEVGRRSWTSAASWGISAFLRCSDCRIYFEVLAGEWENCRGFLTQCGLVFKQLSQSNSCEVAKISYLISLFSAWAHLRAQALLAADIKITSENVLDKFKTLGPILLNKKMFNPKQGNRSVADYMVDFWILAGESSLCSLLQGLSEYTQAELAAKELPLSLNLHVH